MKSLVIVESPAKAKTINKFLGTDFIVTSSIGHIKDLPKKNLSVDIENNFTPDYQIIRGKGKVVSEIKKIAKQVFKSGGKVFLAQDPDREGEAIAWHLAEEVDGNKTSVYRVLFHEITKRSVLEAIERPEKLDIKKYEAQKARRVLDRLVGYKVSPILWEKVRRGLSAGRVQSVALRLICEREMEIKAFVPVEHWSIHGEFGADAPPPFKAKLLKYLPSTKDKPKKVEIKTGEEAQKILDDLKGASYTVKEIERKERRKNPLPPFITSTLQQEASRRFRFTAKKTMMVAQQLYEGVELGKDGSQGLITYMRTDSTRISPYAIEEVREYIASKIGKEFLPPKANFYRNKKSAQDAHEAVRPTTFTYRPESIKGFLNNDQFRLYQLIWNRFVASQMRPAIMDQTTIHISGGDYLFQATGSVVKFAGFLAIYIEAAEEKGADAKDEECILPKLSKGDVLKLLMISPEQHFTQPPPRFSESTLIKELEDKGIGRPSTYATILSNICIREYVTSEKRRFFPTDLGMTVNELLVKSFPEIIDVGFTARMEEDLDRIEEGKIDWCETMKAFYLPFKDSLEKARVEMKNLKSEQTETDVPCSLCGSKMVIKWGRHGKFLACPGYPECKNTTDFSMDGNGKIEIVEKKLEIVEEVCPKCESPMVIKKGRYGRFLACTGYPKCKTTAPLSTGVPCPEAGCKGRLLERQSRKGRVFFSCSKYPDCTYSTWEKPRNEICPECKHPILVETNQGKTLKCPQKGCKYTSRPKG
ncbi:MAG: type I DNA topoisomerase [Thermodesulfobacteriota bacterium]